jgi:thiol-disulfide isomerase/thioredoxin
VNPKNRTMIIIVGAVVLVLALAGVAVLLTGDDDSAGVLAPGESAPGPVELEENRPVEVTGAPVPAHDKQAAVDAAIGMPLPTLTGQTFDGNPITVGGPSDGPTLVVYLAHWCPHCNAEIPELIEVNQRGGFADDLTVVGISTGVDPAAPNYPPSEWLVDQGWPWRTLADSAESTSFVVSGGSGFPYLVVLDADGNILARDSGEKPADELEAWVDDALATANA